MGDSFFTSDLQLNSCIIQMPLPPKLAIAGWNLDIPLRKTWSFPPLHHPQKPSVASHCLLERGHTPPPDI